MRGSGRLFTGLIVGVAVFGAGLWAGGQTLVEPDGAQSAPGSAAVVGEVAEGTVGRSLALSVSVAQDSVLVASNLLAGVVTAVPSHDVVHVGDQVFAVDGVPVVAVVGTLPFYRDLGAGAAGEDVRQVQAALVALGYMSGEPDGKFGQTTTRAVRAWQRSLGVEVTGVVVRGTVVAVPILPASLALGDDIVTGSVVAGGEPAVLASVGDPTFELVVSDEQAAMIPSDAAVEISFEDLSWDARVGSSGRDENGSAVLGLVGADGGVPCGADCGRLPAQPEVSLNGLVHVVAQMTGPAVPVAAVRTGTDGASYVRMESGEDRTVSVEAAGSGLAVVSGLQVGDRYVVIDGQAAPGASTEGSDGDARG